MPVAFMLIVMLSGLRGVGTQGLRSACDIPLESTASASGPYYVRLTSGLLSPRSNSQMAMLS